LACALACLNETGTVAVPTPTAIMKSFDSFYGVMFKISDCKWTIDLGHKPLLIQSRKKKRTILNYIFHELCLFMHGGVVLNMQF